MADEQKTKGQSSWNEYSKLVLKELETLATGIDGLTNEVKTIKEGMARIESRETKIEEHQAWKGKVDEVFSPTQMKALVDKVTEHEIFKTRAVTVFAVVQFLMASAILVQKFL